MAASMSIAQVAGSGTAVNELASADGPPAMADMVNVAPAPIVRVF
jgi:hypothetical protein